jgi:hypothetical protein
VFDEDRRLHCYWQIYDFSAVFVEGEGILFHEASPPFYMDFIVKRWAQIFELL